MEKPQTKNARWDIQAGAIQAIDVCVNIIL